MNRPVSRPAVPAAAADPEHELMQQLEAAWRRSDEIFALLGDHAWLQRPIGLRLPFLFYLGHLPAFAWNQIGRGALVAGSFDGVFDQLFERGIDPEDEISASASGAQAWPSLAETVDYRDRVRHALRQRAGEVFARAPSGPGGREPDELCEHGRVLHLVIEHELMHHETLLYMMAERPRDELGDAAARLLGVDGADGADGDAGRAAQPRKIPAGTATLGARWDELTFGWDNEFGPCAVAVAAFELDSLPVRNRDWLDFQRAHPGDEHLPHAWLRGAAGWSVKTVRGPVPLELAAGWPVQVTCEQAARFCRWRGGRLPTEAELWRAAYGSPHDGPRRYPWGAAAPAARFANVGFRRWCPAPVGRAPDGASAFGVEELVGNGWEWTSTPFAPLPGFRPWARTYPGYSTDFFDDAHNVVFGGSWATADRLLRPSFRNWYRRNYPYPFTSFRVARDA